MNLSRGENVKVIDTINKFESDKTFIDEQSVELREYLKPFVIDYSYFYQFSCVLLLLFVALLMTLKPSVNESYFYIINSASQALPAELLAVITDMGNGVVAGSFLFIFLCFKPEWTLRVLVAAFICTLITHALKVYFGFMRPPALLESINIIGKARHQHSFPSGHTATIFLFAAIYFLSSKKLVLKVAVVLLAILVGISRVSVGAHWPVDVALGAIIGWISAYYACVLTPKPFSVFNKQLFTLLVVYLLLVVGANLVGDDFSDYAFVKILEFFYLLLAGAIFYMKFIRMCCKSV